MASNIFSHVLLNMQSIFIMQKEWNKNIFLEFSNHEICPDPIALPAS